MESELAEDLERGRPPAWSIRMHCAGTVLFEGVFQVDFGNVLIEVSRAWFVHIQQCKRAGALHSTAASLMVDPPPRFTTDPRDATRFP